MRPTFYPRLINDPLDDPGLLVNIVFRKQALLFDLGDLSGLSPGEILKIDPVFVSHTHMDHFIGFDRMLRLLLGRAKRLRLFGPSGFLGNIAGKLSGYTWNLVHTYSEALILEATEIDDGNWTTQLFDARTGFHPSPPRTGVIRDDIIYEDALLCVRAKALDHQITSLAFSVQEHFHVNILKTKLAALDLPVGRWLGHFKHLLHQCAAPDTPVEVPGSAGHPTPRHFCLGDLASRIARITRGQKIAYVADAGYSPTNAAKIVSLARDADHLFIEAAFLHSEQAVAGAKHHLTAHQAGLLARQANATQMTIFHHSPRYTDRAHLLRQEARQAFRPETP